MAADKDLPKELQDALRRLVVQAEQENRDARQEEVKRIQRAREFYKGNQNIVWDAQAHRYTRVTANGLGMPSAGLQQTDPVIRYDYVENIYRPECEVHMSYLRQAPPRCRFVPADFENPSDVATAEAAQNIEQFLAINNKLEKRQADVVYYFDNDGVCLSYTYWEEDRRKYGTRTIPPPMETVQQELSPATATCVGCAQTAEGTPPEACPYCGLASEEAYPPESVVPAQTVETEQPMVDPKTGQPMEPTEEPRGQERIIYLGGLEVARPYFAQTLDDCPWLVWEQEVHQSYLKMVYPDWKSPESSSEMEEDARQARLALKATSYGRTSGESSSITTYRRVWFRSWYFYYEKDEKIVKDLLKRFPNGCYVAFIGGDYCESRPETIEEKWALKHPTPGEGMIRPGLLDGVIDLQRKINNGENIKTEILERGLASRWIAKRAIDFDGYIDAGSQPGNECEILVNPGESINDVVKEGTNIPVSPALINDLDSMRGSRMQKISGNYPELSGGDTGVNTTARGIVEMKESAAGRMSLPKDAMNEFYADTILNGIRCYKKKRKEDVRFTVEGAGSKLDSRVIKLDAIGGNIQVLTDPGDSYPVSLAQKRSFFISAMNSPNEQIKAAIFAPDNYEQFKSITGMELKLPGEGARKKQLREIDAMKQTRQPIDVDVMLDQHDVEIAACNEWASSEDGQLADAELREIVANHMLKHFEAKGMSQALAAAAIQQGAEQAGAPPPQPPQQAPEGAPAEAPAEGEAVQ